MDGLRRLRLREYRILPKREAEAVRRKMLRRLFETLNKGAVEMSAGQMIEDIKLAVECKVPVSHYGRYGGVIHSPTEVLQALEKFIS